MMYVSCMPKIELCVVSQSKESNSLLIFLLSLTFKKKSTRDIKSEAPMHVLSCTSALTCVAWCPTESGMLACAGADATISIWANSKSPVSR